MDCLALRSMANGSVQFIPVVVTAIILTEALSNLYELPIFLCLSMKAQEWAGLPV